MASMDDLLAQLQAEFEQKKANSSQSHPPDSNQPSTDDLLAEIQAQFQKPAAKSHNAMNRNSDDSRLDDLLNAAKSELSGSQSQGDDTNKALEAFKQQSRPQPPMPNQDATDEALKALKQRSRPSQSPTGRDATDEALAAFKNQSRPQTPENSQTEDALASLKSAFQQKQAQSNAQEHKPTDNELESLKNQFAQKVKANKSPPPQTSPATDRVLAQLKQEYKQQQQDVDAQLRNTEDIVRQERLAEQRRQQRRKALQRRAEAWLKDLDINSDEGLWFEEFAYSYDSRLAAAVDYLQALEETRA
ncbi:MAG: hypothetical protein SAJ12_04370 [Jaaginema sp. PMC 1079.18]|nr:hypothetical protein [Jaaginema sp. PMC 1080.18]MEC4850225.1 hypothetical protein [Jaaginema sp. PMC 1079.18]MEC4865890.1 hypothetical protein [Jaaginema sp. PMC 1078.18]